MRNSIQNNKETPKLRWCWRFLLNIMGGVVVAFILCFIWLVWTLLENAYQKWEAARDKLPTNPPTWITTRDVTIQYRVLVIEGSEYILAQDRNGSYISLCPKTK